MLSSERADFETQLAVLFGGYPTFLTPPRIEAYWRGLSKMQLSLFVRCVDYSLGESGTDKLPTVNAIWQISRHLRGSMPQHAQAAPITQHPLQRAANSALMTLLRDRGAASESCIVELVAIKNRIVNSLPLDADFSECRDVLLGAFEQRWVAMPEAERLAAISHRFGTP